MTSTRKKSHVKRVSKGYLKIIKTEFITGKTFNSLWELNFQLAWLPQLV